RDERRVTLMTDFIDDIRYAARMFWKTPIFTAVAVIVIGLGIGATAAIFSAVKPILIEPLPYPDPDKIVTLWDVGGGGFRLEVTFGTYSELFARSRAFSALAVMKSWQPAISGDMEPERLVGQNVSPTYFRVLGVQPVIGRDFEPADDVANSAAN